MTNKKISTLFLFILGMLNMTFCQSFFEARLNEDCNMDLIWNFENNENYDHFTIQWSEDGKSFKSIGMVVASSLNEENKYVFSDNFQSFHNYYRLKLITKDGSNSLSRIIHTKNDCGIDGYMEIYPNPIKANESRLSINFMTNSMTIPILLHGDDGELVKVFNVDTPEEWNTLSMDISGLDSGIYYLEVGEIGMSVITILEEEESLSSK